MAIAQRWKLLLGGGIVALAAIPILPEPGNRLCGRTGQTTR